MHYYRKVLIHGIDFGIYIIRIEFYINNIISFYNIVFRYFFFNIFKSSLLTKSGLYWQAS